MTGPQPPAGGRDLDLRILTHPRQSETTHLLVAALVHELDRAGVPVRLAPDGYPDDLDDGSVFVLPSPERYRIVSGVDPATRPDLLARTVLVLHDDHVRVGEPDSLRWYGHAGGVFATMAVVVALLRDIDIDAQHLRLGRTGAWQHPVDREVDVVARGPATAHFGRVLATCADVLAPRSTELWFDDGVRSPSWDTSVPARQVAGATVALLAPEAEGRAIDGVEVALAMHHGAVVVGERAPGLGPLRAGEHLLSASRASLPAVLLAVLGDPTLRERVAGAAAEWLDEEPLSVGVERLAEAAAALTAQRPAWVGMRALPSRPPERPVGDTEVVRRILREVRLDLFELRRAVQRVEIRSSPEAPSPDEVVTLWRSPGLDGAPPRVSVLTAVYQHADAIGDALRSVLGSRFDDVEVIVVDDGSTDGSGNVARELAQAHPDLPVLVLRHPVNRGLGEARNTALAAARAPLVFVLDADNCLRPEGLGALVEALDRAPDAVMAYGVIDTFDADGPAGVIGVHEWDPERFRSGNYVDAMALSRTDAVRAVGGFTTDRRLYGWEDFDLWCGFAERGLGAVRVPSFVARYRSSPTSMVSVSDYSHHAAFVALAERHPKLMGGVRPAG